jgi:transposase
MMRMPLMCNNDGMRDVTTSNSSGRALRAQFGARQRKKKADPPEASSLDHFEAKTAVWLFIRPLDDLDEKQRTELEALRQASETVETIYQLVQEFLQMVRKRGGKQLESWLTKVGACHIPELRRFANGIERDKAAVLAGLTLSYNNGQTEGQVTRIKLIKRMMYGRAGFALRSLGTYYILVGASQWHKPHGIANRWPRFVMC